MFYLFFRFLYGCQDNHVVLMAEVAFQISFAQGLQRFECCFQVNRIQVLGEFLCIESLCRKQVASLIFGSIALRACGFRCQSKTEGDGVNKKKTCKLNENGGVQLEPSLLYLREVSSICSTLRWMKYSREGSKPAVSCRDCSTRAAKFKVILSGQEEQKKGTNTGLPPAPSSVSARSKKRRGESKPEFRYFITNKNSNNNQTKE